MKKIIILIGFSISLYFGSNAQISINEPKCVSCKGNEISNISSALGVNNTAGGDASFASGELNVSEGAYSTTLGYKNNAVDYEMGTYYGYLDYVITDLARTHYNISQDLNFIKFTYVKGKPIYISEDSTKYYHHFTLLYGEPYAKKDCNTAQEL